MDEYITVYIYQCRASSAPCTPRCSSRSDSTNSSVSGEGIYPHLCIYLSIYGRLCSCIYLYMSSLIRAMHLTPFFAQRQSEFVGEWCGHLSIHLYIYLSMEEYITVYIYTFHPSSAPRPSRPSSRSDSPNSTSPFSNDSPRSLLQGALLVPCTRHAVVGLTSWWHTRLRAGKVNVYIYAYLYV